MDSGRVEKVVVGSHEEVIGRHAGDPPNTIEVEDYEERPVFIPDVSARLEAIKEISLLYQRTNLPEAIKLLEENHRNNESGEVRASAGKALDYSDLRIWAHEHPLAATLTGIATVGVVGGLGYMLYEYLAR